MSFKKKTFSLFILTALLLASGAFLFAAKNKIPQEKKLTQMQISTPFYAVSRNAVGRTS